MKQNKNADHRLARLYMRVLTVNMSVTGPRDVHNQFTEDDVSVNAKST